MPSLLEEIRREYHRCAPFMDRLETVYAAMDRKYEEAATYYGFHCTGCKDNCCRTRFYHHTLLEYLHLMKGYDSLDPDTVWNVVETKLPILLEQSRNLL